MENVDDVINLIIAIYKSYYIEREFYDKQVVEHYIKKINYEKGGAWKGIFLHGKLIAQMLANIENNHVDLKLTMIEEKYRNLGLMNLLSLSMIKEIDLYKESDFKTIFAFVSPTNLPILKILHQFKFINVGTAPPYDIGNDYLIYSKTVFNQSFITIAPHDKLRKNIKEINQKFKFNRKIVKSKSFNYILINNNYFKIRIVSTSEYFPKKYLIYHDDRLCGEFYENVYTYSWYDLKLTTEISMELKDLIVKKLVKKFENSYNLTSFSIITDINDASIQEMLLNLKFQYYAFLPLFFGDKDGVLMGRSKIR